MFSGYAALRFRQGRLLGCFIGAFFLRTAAGLSLDSLNQAGFADVHRVLVNHAAGYLRQAGQLKHGVQHHIFNDGAQAAGAAAAFNRLMGNGLHRRVLKRQLDATVESCVNTVGIDVNTASRQLLSYVSGIGDTLAANIVNYRAEHGDFTSRASLLKVPRLGPKAYEQCAGFLRVIGAGDLAERVDVRDERLKREPLTSLEVV